MYTHPGQKINFMGGEIGEREEWDVNKSLSWDLLQHEPHKGIQNLVRDLNNIFSSE